MIAGRYNYGRIRLTTVGRPRRLRVRLTQCGHSCSYCGFGAAANLTQSGQKNAMSASRPVDDCGRLQVTLPAAAHPSDDAQLLQPFQRGDNGADTQVCFVGDCLEARIKPAGGVVQKVEGERFQSPERCGAKGTAMPALALLGRPVEL